jgi:large subunit ribosomal protein L23
MAWFWQRKRDEKEKQQAQKSAQQVKRGLLQKTKKPATVGKESSRTKKVEKATKSARPVVKATVARETAGILLGPIVTEKAARLAENGTYVFAVRQDANKIQIAQAVGATYGVTPVSVAVVNQSGKPKIFAQRAGSRSGLRKAYVTLKTGEQIELFEQRQG